MPPKAAQKGAKSLPSTIPDPFVPAPTELASLLSTLDTECVYITHVDNHPAWFKQRVFYVPVGLNLTIAVLLVWRLYAAGPWYWALIMSFLGHQNETTIIYATTAWLVLIRKVVWRSAIFLFDFLLFRVVGPWPWSFFFEPGGNPVSWRLRIGFRDAEVYIRESRGWGAQDLLGEAEGSSGKAGGESPFFKTRILPAVDQKRLKEKTGYMLMDQDFDLAFGPMVTATRLVDKKEASLDQLRTSVFAWIGTEKSGQWVVWNCWQLDEGSETQAREKVMLFKDRLTAIGKENLFFKWVELIQYESSHPEGFTHERQVETANKAKKLFEEQGVDFDEFMNEIGGLSGMPGMD